MDDLCLTSAAEARARIAAGRLTSEELLRACLARIAEREPELGAWAWLDAERALAAARACDRVPARGPLHGIPIGVKDIMDTADMPTEYGARLYQGFRPRADAACVALARDAGAIVLGKTVTTEFAALSPGKTRNPHNPARTPGGSSSGSAVGVADFMVPLAFGTQTAGSIIRPAAFCGVVGYKPSFGLIATAGTKALAPSLDTIGGFARSVADAALFIAAVSGRPDLVPQQAAVQPRIGLYRTEPWDAAEPATVAALERAAERLARAGAHIERRPAFPAFAKLGAAQTTIMGYEMARNLAWEQRQGEDGVMPRTATLLAEGAAIAPGAYDAARREVSAARAQLTAFFAGCDAMLVPAARGEAPALSTTGDPVFNRPWTMLHLPCIALPATRGPAGLPIAIQLVGRAEDDAGLLRVARFAEAALAGDAP